MAARTCKAIGAIPLLLSLGCAALSFAPPDLSVEVVSYGRYDAEYDGLFKRKPRIYRTPQQTLVEQTDRIPCREGEHFGVAYRIVERGGQSTQFPLTVAWQHPEVHEELDQIHGTHTEYRARVWLQEGATPVRYSGWGFNHESDLAEGTWTLELRYEGATLLRRSFEVSGCDLRAASVEPAPPTQHPPGGSDPF